MTKRTTTICSTSALDRVSAYARAVLDGDIVAGPHVRNACRRHFDDLEKGSGRGLYFDDAAAGRVFRFFEEKLKLSEGQFDGKPFKLHPAQAFILGSIFGWMKGNGMRRYRYAYVEQGKGNGKSPLAGGIGLYGLCADREPGSQIYAAASRKDQAAILFNDAVKMVKQSPDLYGEGARKIKLSGGAGREFNMAYHHTQSFFRPISREAGKTGSGPRPHFALCDEVHEHPDRGIMEMLERGFKFREQPLLFMITNSGSDRNSICWEEHEAAVRVAAGTQTPDDDFTYVGETWDGSDERFAYVCALDKNDDPLNDPSCWIKANPLLGTILTNDYLAGVVAQAKAMPGKANGILRLHFCVWTDVDVAWISRETLEPVMHDFDVDDHTGRDAYIGIDLSATQDLTAVAVCVPTGVSDDGNPTFDAWVEAWTPEDTLSERAMRDKVRYDLWARDGWLKTTPGKVIGFGFVAARVAELCSKYAVKAIAYDSYAFNKLFEPELDIAGVTVPLVEHPQGGKKKGDGGLWFPGSKIVLEGAILEKRIRLLKSPVLIHAMMSATIAHDEYGNEWFSKKKSINRIDPLVSLTMAVGAAAGDVGDKPSIYHSRGLLIL